MCRQCAEISTDDKYIVLVNLYVFSKYVMFVAIVESKEDTKNAQFRRNMKYRMRQQINHTENAYDSIKMGNG